MSNVKKDISFVVSHHLCLSCGACYAACKNNAITFHETAGGYLFPKIDRNLCINCGLCYKVCPGINYNRTLPSLYKKTKFSGKILSGFVGRAADDDVFKNSQSGGVATALLGYLFDAKLIGAAIVAVMQEATPPRGDVKVVCSKDELVFSQKSKYTPIPLLKAIKQISQIKSGIAIVGLPCHIHGLCNLFDVFPELTKTHVYKIGLICEGIMTAVGIDFMGHKATTEQLKHFVWRDKTCSSYPGKPVAYTVKNQKIVLKSSLRMAIKNFFLPTRCLLCFDKLNALSDIVIGDPHGIDGIDRLNGESLTLVFTTKGMEIIKQAIKFGAVILRGTNIADAVKGQGIDKKGADWQGYMQAWSSMGKPMPSYSFELATSTCSKEHVKGINRSLKLDYFPKRKDLIRAANTYLFKKKINKVLFRSFLSIKNLFKNFIKRGT
jgi:coenzyme F420 hydrogenase subunit beta